MNDRTSMNKKISIAHTLGYPRIGEKRELKRATEAYWQGKITRAELEETGRALRRQNWLTQKAAGIDLIPSNDFSFYDQMLDLTCLVGNIPARFGWRGQQVDLDTRFAVARGVSPRAEAHTGSPACRCASCQPAVSTFASEMTKWFDTNYHYIVPEFHSGTVFKLSATKVFDEFSEALALGIRTKPVLVGPVTYLKLGKVLDAGGASFNRLELLPRLLPVYIEVLRNLAALGAEWVQLDEPILSLDLTPEERSSLTAAYATLAAAAPSLKLMVANYFGGLRDNLRTFLGLPVHALHFDVTREPRELDTILREFDGRKLLSLGVVDGRNIWRSDFAAILPLLGKAISLFGAERFLVAPSCSLQHVPVTLRNEARLDPELKGWLAYAEEKLAEVVTLRDLACGIARPEAAAANEAAVLSRRSSPRIHRPEVKERVAG